MLVNINTLERWGGEPIDGVRHPLNIEQLWTDQELLAVGLVRPVRFQLPEGKVISGPVSYVKNQDGTVSETYPISDAPGPSLDDVKEECKGRILAVVSVVAQSNINAYINGLNLIVTGGGTLTDAQKADTALFNRAMDWINAMRAVCPTLVGDLTYTSDNHWPTLTSDLVTFAARF